MMAIKNIGLHLFGLKQRNRRKIIIILDVLLLCAATVVALKLSANSLEPASLGKIILASGAYLIATQLLFMYFRVHRAIIRHLTISVIIHIALVLFACSALLTVFLYSEPSAIQIPELFFTLHSLLTIGVLTGYRGLLYAIFGLRANDDVNAKPIGIFGTHLQARQFAAAQQAGKRYKPQFFITSDQSLAGGMIDGVRVYGLDQMDWATRRFSPRFVVFCCSQEEFSAHRATANRLLDMGVPVRLQDRDDQGFATNENRHLARKVDIHDLIGRKQNPVDETLLKKSVAGRRVLVTGGAGSIGSMLSERIAELEPETLVILDHDEKALAHFRRKLDAKNTKVEWKLANVCDSESLEPIFRNGNFDIIFHAAAYKHVDIGETMAIAVIRNNIFGTKALIDKAVEHGVPDLIMISTDKAVEPANVMGASKSWCEELVRYTADKHPNLHYASVRFGNVIESSGSVVPMFKQQIAAGGPVKITDKRMDRYFMALEEAVDLILQSASIAKGGETFVLKMGQPVNIVSLAETLIKLAGRTVKSEANPSGEIEIIETGLRPGEKLNESLFQESEIISASVHDAISISRKNAPTKKAIDNSLAIITKAIENGNEEHARDEMFEALNLVTGYQVQNSRGRKVSPIKMAG